MKHISKILFYLSIAAVFAACEKVADLPVYKSGTTPVLSASASAVTAVPADSLKTVLTLSWTNPKSATDSASMKYVIEFDSSGRNFAKSTSVIVTGALSASFTARDLNTILLSYGFNFNVAYNVDVRVTSSYANNDDRLTSNTVTIKMTPYLIPPKVTPPSTGHLYLVGDATAGGWNNPVPVPSQEFAKLDSVTYAGVFNLTAGGQYLMLPLNGDWTHKFSVANTGLTGLAAGGDFGFDLPGNFPGPATSGWYRIVVDFQHGKFTVTPYTGVLPANLYIVGDATAGGWNNPVPVPSQQLTRLNSSVWQISIALTAGGQYLLLPVNGDWTHKYAVANTGLSGLAAGGEFGYDLSGNFPGPTLSKTYTITVNFAANTSGTGSAGVFTVN